jgi:predicted  nucleic acid-binding Zn-ribbon protein
VPHEFGSLAQAEDEAREFLRRAKALRDAMKETSGTHPKECGALRRSSMELSRSLSAMRKRWSFTSFSDLNRNNE